jgi:hypothetical protein
VQNDIFELARADVPLLNEATAAVAGAFAMCADVLTSDNPPLSRPKNTPPDGPDNPSNEAQAAPSENQRPPSTGQFVQLLASGPERGRRPG